MAVQGKPYQEKHIYEPMVLAGRTHNPTDPVLCRIPVSVHHIVVVLTCHGWNVFLCGNRKKNSYWEIRTII